MKTWLSVLDMVIIKTSGHTSSTYTLVLLLYLLYIAWPHLIPHRGAPHYQSLRNIPPSKWLTRKFKISVWTRVNWASVLSHELQQSSKSRVHQGRKSYFGDCYRWCHDWITWLIKFLSSKSLYGHVPDPFPHCGMGSGHVRLHLGLHFSTNSP